MKNIKKVDKDFEEYEKKHTVISKKAKYAGIALISLLGAGGVVTASVLPTVIKNSSGGSVVTEGREVSIDEAIQHVKCYSKVVNNNLEIYLVVDEGYDVTGISKVSINNQDLSSEDYSYSNNVVIVKKSALDKHSGKVIVKPSVDVSSIVDIMIENEPIKTGYLVGETVNLTDGLLVKALKSDKSLVTIPLNDLSFSMDKTHVITEDEAGSDIPVTVTYKNKTATFYLNAFKEEDFANMFTEIGDCSIGEDECALTLNVSCPSNIKHLIIPEKFNNKKVKEVAIDEEQPSEDLYKRLYQLESIDFSRATNIEYATYDSDDAIFRNLPNLKKIVLNEGMKNLGDCSTYSFSGCPRLESVYIPSTLESYDSIGDAFKNCPSLKNIFINSTILANIEKDQYGEGNYLFDNAINVYVKDSIEVKSDPNLYLNRYFEKTTQSEYSGYTKYYQGSFISPSYYSDDNACSIKDGANFNGNKSQTIPAKFFNNDVIAIEDSAFQNMFINELIFADSISMINAGAFNYSTIKKLVLNEGLTQIGNSGEGFYESVIGEINIPSTIEGSWGIYCDTPDSVEVCIVDSKAIALTDDANGLYKGVSNCRGKIKVLTEFTEEEGFENSWIMQNKDQSIEPTVEGKYTVYKIR